ncbi:uncharacterized protein LOC112086186 [Eutrema salsugineum]|uniref:uncharacterized protein LOC112086186 n=1 Tax=Eutrema salsugineum TaxID=72664 RepID=UPI000CED7C1A|nr:uncharacterized protein LOC112086186 [Eutrema salsugineum]
MFKDAQDFSVKCDVYQRAGNISKRHEMPQNPILEVEVFDCWSIDFMGPFPTSYGGKPLSPQTSGQLEVFNRQIKAILERTVNSTRKDWSKKLDDALWAYRNAFKTPIGTSPFNLLIGKSFHLPVELEYKALWAFKLLNFDIKTAQEKRLFQLHELDEIRLDAYESSRIYKERTKSLHDQKILKRDFKEGDLVLLFNSRLKLLPGKLRSRWSSTFKIMQVRSYGAIELKGKNGKGFVVNGQRLKPYLVNKIKEGASSVPLDDLPSK